MRLANLRKKAILGVPLPVIAILAVTISAGLALFVAQQRFVGSVDITETSALLIVSDGLGDPLTTISFGVSLPADVIGVAAGTDAYEETFVFEIEREVDGDADLAVWAYLEGLNPLWFEFTISAVCNLVDFPDITDPLVRAQGTTLGLTPAFPTAVCTLTVTSINGAWMGESSVPFELVVHAEQVTDWPGFS